MSEDKNEYAVVSKVSGKILDTFWAVPAAQWKKAREKWDLRKVNIVKIYPREN